MEKPTYSPSQILFSNQEIKPGVKVSVVIPVKDEEYYIEKVLHCFVSQIDLEGNQFDRNFFEILILANNCSDLSVNYIKHFQQEHPEINLFFEDVLLLPKHSNIGFVRKTLMDCANARLLNNGGGIIMTTDGDTLVAEDWIAQNIAEIEKGADAVGGRILIEDDEMENLDETTQLFHFTDEKYQLLTAQLEGFIMNNEADPNPRHHQHFNGSFAVSTECYIRSGGVPEVKNLEDCAFFDRLQRMDAKVRHSFHVKVYTSARCIGRTDIGLSYQLNVWKNLKSGTEEYMVESADSIQKRFHEKKKLFTLWQKKNHPDVNVQEKLQRIIPGIKISDADADSLMKETYFGTWYEAIMHLKAKQFPTKAPGASSIEEAIADLKNLTELHQCESFVQTSNL